MDLVERFTGMVNALPEEEQGKWIYHILGSLLWVIEGEDTSSTDIVEKLKNQLVKKLNGNTLRS